MIVRNRSDFCTILQIVKHEKCHSFPCFSLRKDLSGKERQNMKSLPIDMSGKVSTILVRLRFRPVIDLTVVSLDLLMRFELRRLGTPNSLFC